MKNKRLILAGVMIFVLIISLASCSGKNLKIKNSDFEKGSGSEISGWEQWNYKKDYEKNNSCTTITLVDKGFSGQCVKIESKNMNDARIYQKIKVKPNSKYKVQFDTLYEDIDPDGVVEKKGAGLNISTKDGFERTGAIYGTITEWHTVTAYFTTVENQKSVELTIGIGGYSSESRGVAYIDNVKVEKVETIPEGASVFSAKTTSSSSTGHGASIWLKLLFVTLGLVTIVFTVILCMRADKENAAKKTPLSQKNPILGKKDFIVLIVMTLICSVMSFYKLGNMYAASSFWKAEEAGDYVIVEFDEISEITRTVYSCNIPADRDVVSYTVYYEETDGQGDYKKIFNIKNGAFFEWERVTNEFKTKRVKIERANMDPALSGLSINEMGFFTGSEEEGFKKVSLRVVDKKYNSSNESADPGNLFDEQDTVEPYTSYMSGTYFDEIYFPRTAYESIHGFNIYEITHPPMGKNIMSLGIRMFGMNPFGWRFMGTLFGVALVPLMYLLALKVFKNRLYSFTAAFLIMFDFMRLAQTRLATIDSYSAFFIMLMYYFMYDYFTQKSYEKKEFWKTLIPLALCGVAFGLGASTKWVCIYTGVGLAFLFFLAKFLEFNDIASGRANVCETKKSWFTFNFVPTCCACVIFFIAIPLVIYTLSYIPYMASSDKGLLDIMLNNQDYMFKYHSGLTAGHAYGSAWYTWPLDIRPIYYYSGSKANLGEGMATSIVSLGNPLIWWTGFACIIPAGYFAWKKRDKGMVIAFVGYAVQFLPWVLVTRVAFIYHYFTAVPFLILMLVYVIKNLIEDRIISTKVLWVYLALVLILFIMFYPVLTGREVSRQYINNFLRWFSTWGF